MPDVIFIGRGMKDYAETLRSDGLSVRTFYSPQRALRWVDSVRLLVMNLGGDTPQKNFLNETKNIPKVIISDASTSRGQNPWLKKQFAYPLHSPSQRELRHFVRRILQEFDVMGDHVLLKKNLSYLGKEIAFFEEINRMLTSSHDINKILVTVMKKIREFSSAEAWSIMLLDETTGDLILEHAEGKARKKISHVRLGPKEGVAGWVANKGVAVVVPDVMKDRRFSEKIDQLPGFETRSLMAAPIKSQGEVIGVLEVINRANGRGFTEEDLDLLMRFVDQAALAVERVLLYQKLQEMVITDDLTNLFNTRYLNRSIDTEVQRSERYGSSLSLIFMDIDFFKNINDNYGHLVGSKLLVEMGQLLINSVRTIDIVARYGGDEFVIVLPQTDTKDAVIVAERTRKAIEKNAFLRNDGINIKVTASFGVASFPDRAKTKEELLRLADEAMYKVKHRNRNGVYAIV